MQPPLDAREWIAIGGDPLPVEAATTWATVPETGATVTFIGTVRDHAEGREGVSALEYEAYEGPAVARMHEIADEARRRWPQTRRVALLHRVGRLALCDTAVAVVVSATHRGEAFEAAAWAIDTLKESVPIWKREEWTDGEAWGTGAAPITDHVPSA